MTKNSDNSASKSGEHLDNKSRKFEIAGGQDLPDTPQDLKEMQPEETVIDLPDVSDIPGQQNVRPAPMSEMSDITIASDDEEGVGIFDEEEDEADDDLVMGTEADVTKEEKKDLQHADEDVNTTDENNLRRASLDNEDEEGEPLNEVGFGEDVSGDQLDVPGPEADDADSNQNKEIGEEDEENDFYSMEDDDINRTDS